MPIGAATSEGGSRGTGANRRGDHVCSDAGATNFTVLTSCGKFFGTGRSAGPTPRPSCGPAGPGARRPAAGCDRRRVSWRLAASCGQQRIEARVGLAGCRFHSRMVMAAPASALATSLSPNTRVRRESMPGAGRRCAAARIDSARSIGAVDLARLDGVPARRSLAVSRPAGRSLASAPTRRCGSGSRRSGSRTGTYLRPMRFSGSALACEHVDVAPLDAAIGPWRRVPR